MKKSKEKQKKLKRSSLVTPNTNMKLTLKNFRCHEKRTFNIPENGLVNLSGSSGDGKSTVFASMVYAFYGKIPGKSKKPYSHGKDTCKVRLQYETYGLDITRTSKPNRVIVTREEGEYEGDSAQCVIEETLGMTYEEFIAGAYIIQRSNASVLSMTPKEQVKFIEILASTNAEDFKLTVKEKQKDLTNKLLKLQGELDSFQTLLEEAENNLQEEPETPQEIEDGIDPLKIRSDIKKNDREIQKIRDVSKKLQAELQKARKDDIKYKSDQEKIEVFKATLASTKLSINKLGGKKKSDGHKAKLEELKVCLIYNKKVETLKDRKEKFLEAFEAYKFNTAETLNAMEGEILTLIQLKTLEEQLEKAIEYKTNYDNEKAVYDSIMKKKENAKKKIASLFHEIKSDSFCAGFCKDIKAPLKMIKALTSIQEQISCKLTCPSCNTNLFLGDGKLKVSTIESSDLGSSSGEDLQKEKVSYFIHELSKYTEDSNIRARFALGPPEDVMRLQKEYMRRKREIEDYEKLKAQKLPPVLAKMENSIKKEEALLGDEKEDDINILETGIDELKRIIEKIERENKEWVTLKKEEETLQRKIKNKTLSLPHLVGESKKLEEKLSKSTKKLVDINEKVSNLRNVLENIKDYEDYQSQILNIKSLKKRIKKVQTCISEKTSLMEGYLGLEGICKEAEILALEDTVASINEHAKIYLDYFFEDPILVRLECVKEVKSKKTFKLQMNTTIEYKGDTYGDIEELSGGERQRCDMAFLLAVNDILGGKMLLLDECLNNLDASINTEVLGLVRDLCGTDKLVLVISHEAVKGLFDYEIEVGKK